MSKLFENDLPLYVGMMRGPTGLTFAVGCFSLRTSEFFATADSALMRVSPCRHGHAYTVIKGDAASKDNIRRHPAARLLKAFLGKDAHYHRKNLILISPRGRDMLARSMTDP